MTQIENLEAMLAQGKDGALVRYGLGTAYAAMPDQAAKEQAKAHLTACVGFDPEYSAAYLKLAQVLQSLGDIAEADEIYSQGIAVATRQGDKQAAKTMTVLQKKASFQSIGTETNNSFGHRATYHGHRWS